MSYGIEKSLLWITYAYGAWRVIYTTQPTNKKLGVRVTKMVFIRYSEHSKEYLIVREHLNGSMTKVYSHNVEFLEDEFPSVGEIKKDLKLYKLR